MLVMILDNMIMKRTSEDEDDNGEENADDDESVSQPATGKEYR